MLGNPVKADAINNPVDIGNYILYPVIKHNGKECEKEYMHT